MSMVYKLQAGALMPALTVPKIGGGEVTIGSAAGWQMVVVYRGKHCPICRTYLKTLDRLLDDFHGIGTEVVAVSADPQEKAERARWPRKVGASPSAMGCPSIKCGHSVSTSRSRAHLKKPIVRSRNPVCSLLTRPGDYRSSISPMHPSHGLSFMAC